MNFYSVIIGTELLNGRRQDAHFAFLNQELLRRGWEHKASFVIQDEPPFMEDIFKLIQQDKDSVMFSFGGIGATPDDYTRQCAANVFTNGNMEVNSGAKDAILDKFGDEAYPHRVKMASLPIDAKLLKNVVTNVPGFYLEDRFFFVPGFPSMAQHMIVEALDTLYPKNKAKYRLTLSAFCSENDLIDIMQNISSDVELSSLPIIEGDVRKCVISISGYDKKLCTQELNKFVDFCKLSNVYFELSDLKSF
jgi:molybdopterin-biosynthesis enzyme MoeA-like protein